MTCDRYYRLHARMIRAIGRLAHDDAKYWAVNRRWYRWAEARCA